MILKKIVSLILTINNISIINVFVAQWIARWTSNPEVAGSNPVEDELFLCKRCALHKC